MFQVAYLDKSWRTTTLDKALRQLLNAALADECIDVAIVSDYGKKYAQVSANVNGKRVVLGYAKELPRVQFKRSVPRKKRWYHDSTAQYYKPRNK